MKITHIHKTKITKSPLLPRTCTYDCKSEHSVHLSTKITNDAIRYQCACQSESKNSRGIMHSYLKLMTCKGAYAVTCGQFWVLKFVSLSWARTLIRLYIAGIS